jgi:hypothetical protein
VRTTHADAELAQAELIVEAMSAELTVHLVPVDPRVRPQATPATKSRRD